MDGGQGARSSAERTVQECQQTPPPPTLSALSTTLHHRGGVTHTHKKKSKTNDQLAVRKREKRQNESTNRTKLGVVKKKRSISCVVRVLCVTGLHFPLPCAPGPPPPTPPPSPPDVTHWPHNQPNNCRAHRLHIRRSSASSVLSLFLSVTQNGKKNKPRVNVHSIERQREKKKSRFIPLRSSEKQRSTKSSR